MTQLTSILCQTLIWKDDPNMIITQVPKDRIVNIDEVINFFNTDPLKFDNSSLSRLHNTNDFIFTFTHDNFSEHEGFICNGMVKTKYIDIWPSSVEDIFMEPEEWRLRRFCPMIDLFEERGLEFNAFDTPLDYASISNFIIQPYGIDPVSCERLSVSYLPFSMIESIREKLNGNGLPVFVHANPMNNVKNSWVFMGLRFMVDFDEHKNSIKLLNGKND